MQQINSNNMNLNETEQAVEQQKYQPKTLKQHNHGRYAYLASFPTTSMSANVSPLLANVPVTRLTSFELTRRQQEASISNGRTPRNNYKYSSNEPLTLSEKDAQELATHLDVNMSIIIFNVEQLREICHHLLALRQTYRRDVFYMHDSTLKETTLNSKEMTRALEFFLQIDVDIFYMKTCSFHQALIDSGFHIGKNGLFCGDVEPKSRYTMIPCGKHSCTFCHAINIAPRTDQLSTSTVDFLSSSMHVFLNGYTTYLNGPVTCDTTHIIYAMTCPCGQYDFIDSTEETLADALAFHRKHGNRFIHETLTGSSLFPGMFENDSYIGRQRNIMNRMRLYQHSARCPMALRRFLDVNPDYWHFIPLLWQDAQAENLAYLQGENASSNMQVINIDKNSVIAIAHFDDSQLAHCLKAIPVSPVAYTFSYEQKQKQRFFFEQFLATPVDQLPYSPVDLYKVATIAVLPNDCSSILRYIIETLFIIHGETKLNMICPIGGDSQQRYGHPYDRLWCENLNRPYMTTSAVAATAAASTN